VVSMLPQVPPERSGSSVAGLFGAVHAVLRWLAGVFFLAAGCIVGFVALYLVFKAAARVISLIDAWL